MGGGGGLGERGWGRREQGWMKEEKEGNGGNRIKEMKSVGKVRKIEARRK